VDLQWFFSESWKLRICCLSFRQKLKIQVDC